MLYLARVSLLAAAGRFVPAAFRFHGVVRGFAGGRSPGAKVGLDCGGRPSVASLQPGKAGGRAVEQVDWPGLPRPRGRVTWTRERWEGLAGRQMTACGAWAFDTWACGRGPSLERARFFIRDPGGDGLRLKAFRFLGQALPL